MLVWLTLVSRLKTNEKGVPHPHLALFEIGWEWCPSIYFPAYNSITLSIAARHTLQKLSDRVNMMQFASGR